MRSYETPSYSLESPSTCSDTEEWESNASTGDLGNVTKECNAIKKSLRNSNNLSKKDNFDRELSANLTRSTDDSTLSVTNSLHSDDCASTRDEVANETSPSQFTFMQLVRNALPRMRSKNGKETTLEVVDETGNWDEEPVVKSKPLSLIAQLAVSQRIQQLLFFKKLQPQMPKKSTDEDEFPLYKNRNTAYASKIHSNTEEFPLILLLLTIALIFGTQNLLAPNMSLIAESFKFNDVQRNQLIGGELTFLFYTPGTFGALLVGILSGTLSRK
ncbi:hypothetical protein IE077_003833 [Cardiosporidium cionae]|uniref:Uncharacterized protein n=1 Tax=Cardiosporidium cionae TaxID=476202 RepID=A0ABQ7JEI0_9APIC|nr:hypothetical protein IE077_003833 [Cardiosporidium cionae]|eukprot:KAF8822406.1 hypothetical protein IE077_003833 [Cardiosporidium cionae]